MAQLTILYDPTLPCNKQWDGTSPSTIELSRPSPKLLLPHSFFRTWYSATPSSYFPSLPTTGDCLHNAMWPLGHYLSRDYIVYGYLSRRLRSRFSRRREVKVLYDGQRRPVIRLLVIPVTIDWDTGRKIMNTDGAFEIHDWSRVRFAPGFIVNFLRAVPDYPRKEEGWELPAHGTVKGKFEAVGRMLLWMTRLHPVCCGRVGTALPVVPEEVDVETAVHKEKMAQSPPVASTTQLEQAVGRRVRFLEPW